MILLLLILSVTTAEWKSEKALIIEPTTKGFDDLDFKPDDKLPFRIITACPASTQPEKEFDKQVSLSGNSLFSRQFHPKNEYLRNIRQNICDKPFKPVMIYDYENGEYEIGYEFYYEDGKEIKFQPANETYYHRYRSVKYTKNQTDYERMNRTAPSRNFVIIYENGKEVKFNFTDGSRTLIFHWMSVLKMKLSGYHKRITRGLTYTFWPCNLPRKCQYYSSADENIFSEKNQAIYLRDILMPASISEENINTSCGQSYGCLVNSQIAPLLYFRSRAERLASCSYLNMIPVWKTIAEEQLKKVDAYVMAMDSTFLPHKVFGVSGILKMAKTSHPNETRELYLLDSNTQKIIPIPKIIYRIIEYHRFRGRDDLDKSKWKIPKYAAAIIIHNDPSPISDDERLCAKESVLEGWHKINSEDPRTGLTYVCPVTSELNDKLAVYDHLASDTFQPLNLTAVPFSYNLTNWDPEDKVYYLDYTNNIDENFEDILKTEYSAKDTGS